MLCRDQGSPKPHQTARDGPGQMTPQGAQTWMQGYRNSNARDARDARDAKDAGVVGMAQCEWVVGGAGKLVPA